MLAPLLKKKEKKKLIVMIDPLQYRISCKYESDLSNVARDAYIHHGSTSGIPLPQTVTTFERQKNGKLCKICTQYFALNKIELTKLKKCRISMMRNYILTIIRTSDQYFDTQIEHEGHIEMRGKIRAETCTAFACVVYAKKLPVGDNDVRGLGQIHWQYLRS